MNFQFYFEKLLASEKFQEFKKTNPEVYLCGGFFVLDKSERTQDNKFHLDYYNPSTKEMFSFQLENQIQKIPIEKKFTNAEKPKKIPDNIEINLQEIEKLIQEQMQKKSINKKIEKILLSLQNKENKNFLIGTVFISGMGLLKIVINLQEQKIIEFEKKSFFDMIKIKKDNLKNNNS